MLTNLKGMSQNNFEFVPFTQDNLQPILSLREGETKIGEVIQTTESRKGGEKYLLLGINEDFGPQLNGGKPGCTKAFGAFLSRFVNMQSNQFLSGSEIFILGQINTTTDFQSVDKQTVIGELDELVCEILLPYLKEGIIPIVIGGGHNNAYPLLKAGSLAKNQKIGAVNCDPHADFRKRDYRHSGNPFSYAFYDGFLQNYSVIGLHEAYNNQFILGELEKHSFFYRFFDTWLQNPQQFDLDLEQVKKTHQTDFFGLELDMDAIAFMPSSALSPSGISVETARKYVSKMALSTCVYLHLPEAAPQNDSEIHLVGKTLAYLVSDFVKNQQKQH